MNIEIPEVSEVIELNRQAIMLMAIEKYDEAIVYLEKAKEIDPMEKETYFNLGNIYGTKKEYDIAEEYFKKAVLLDGKDGLAYFNLGNLYLMKQDTDKGIENYNKAIEKGYDEAIIYYNLGLVYEGLNKDVFAIRNYSKAIAKEPLNAEYRLQQVSLYVKNDRYDEALEALENLNQFCPDIFEGYYFRFEIYLANKEFDKAEEVINKAIELFPEDVSLFYNKIRLVNIQGKFDEALKMIEVAKKMDGFEVEERNLEFEAAKIYAQKQDMDNTIKTLEKCISYEKENLDYEARFLLMNTHLLNKDYEKVLENAEILSKEEEARSSYVMAAIYYRALCFKNLERVNEANIAYKEAKKLYRAFTISNPQNLEAYMYRVLCCKDTEEYETAIELCDYVLLLKEDMAEVYLVKGDIYSMLKDDKNSKKNYELAKKYNPSLEIISK